jgi:hypothetical protein
MKFLRERCGFVHKATVRHLRVAAGGLGVPQLKSSGSGSAKPVKR